MTLDQLLEDLQQRNHGQRWQHLVEVSRDTPPAALAKIQDELESGDWFAQFTSLQIALIRKDAERVVRALHSTSRVVRTTAARRLPKVLASLDNLGEVILALPASLQKPLLKSLGRSKDSDIVDALAPALKSIGLQAVAMVLPACSESVVEQYVSACEPYIGNWSRLARRHPTLVLKHIVARLEEANASQRQYLWGQYGNGFEAVLDQLPEEAIKTLAKHCKSFSSLMPSLQSAVLRLYGQFPDTCAAIVFSNAALKNYRSCLGVPLPILSRARTLSESHLQILVDALLPKSESLCGLMRILPWSQRRKLVESAIERDIQCDWAPAFLAQMPWEIRQREAHRILSQAKRMQKARRLEHIELLPFDDASEQLELACRGSRAEDRAAGYRALVRCGARNDRMHDVLERLQQTKNDQDPVRVSWLAEFAATSPARFRDESLPLIGTLIQQMLEAPDVSHESLDCAAQWLFRLLLRENAESSMPQILQWMAAVSSQRRGSLLPSLRSFGGHHQFFGGASFYRYQPWVSPLLSLPRGTEHALVAAIADVLETQNKAERYGATMELARGLAARGWEVPRLQSLLEEATRAHDKQRRHQAIELWLENPKTRDERVEALLDADPSVIVIPRVFLHLHLRRQDLLDRYLGDTAHAGKFLSGRQLYLLPVSNGFYRWLPRQQTAFGKRLDRWLRQKSTDAFGVRWGMRVRASLHVTSIEELTRRLDGGDRVVREAVLGALPCLDRIGAGVEVLLENLSGDEAKVGMYALPRCLAELHRDAQCDLIGSILNRDRAKVTVYKEALRLLGRFPGERSMVMLSEFAERPKLHRDVRIAVGHAASRNLDDERAWRIVERLADDSDPEVVNSLILTDRGAISSKSRRRFVKLLLPLAAHSNSDVREHFFVHAMNWAWSARAPFLKVASERLVDVEQSPEWEAAVNVAIGLVDGKTAPTVIAACKHLRDAVEADWDAAKERDLPSLQRLHHVVQTLVSSLSGGAAMVADGVADLLREDPRTADLGIQCRVATLSREEGAPAAAKSLFAKLASDLEEFPIGLTIARQTLHQRARFARSLADLETETLQSLSQSENAFERVVSVLLLELIGEESQWPEKHRRLLRVLRADGSELVRFTAHQFFVASEQQ